MDFSMNILPHTIFSLKTKCAMCSDSCLAVELDHSLLCCTPVGSAIRWPWGAAEFTLLHCHHHTHTHYSLNTSSYL